MRDMDEAVTKQAPGATEGNAELRCQQERAAELADQGLEWLAIGESLGVSAERARLMAFAARRRARRSRSGGTGSS